MKLNLIAETLRVHPRTILRAITLKKSPYWAYDYDPDVRVADVAAAFNCSYGPFLNAIKTGTPLYTQAEAARMSRVPLRTFRHRAYRPFAYKSHKIVRYTKAQIIQIKESL